MQPWSVLVVWHGYGQSCHSRRIVIVAKDETTSRYAALSRILSMSMLLCLWSAALLGTCEAGPVVLAACGLAFGFSFAYVRTKEADLNDERFGFFGGGTPCALQGCDPTLVIIAV